MNPVNLIIPCFESGHNFRRSKRKRVFRIFYGILLEKGRTLRYERRVRLSAETGAGCSNISAALKQMEELSLEDYYGFGK